MEENILDVLGLQLVDYFLNFHNYKPFKIPPNLVENDKGKVYLINRNHEQYQIIKIIKQEIFNHSEVYKKDEVIELIKSENFSKSKQVKELLIVINNDNRNETNNAPVLDLIIATPMKILNELEKAFPDIKEKIKIDFKNQYEEEHTEVEDSEQLSMRERKWRKINFQNRRFLKDALIKSTNPHLVSTWFIIVIPIITFIVMNILMSTSFANSDVSENTDILTLIFGGSYHNLIFGANQYWRWITYPLVAISPVNLFINLYLFYLVGRYVEGFYGTWKAVLIWVSSVILTGIIQSSIDQYGIFSGFLPLTAISLGAMIPIIYNYKLFKSKLVARLCWILALLLIFWIITNFPILDFIHFLIGFVVGWLMGAVVSYHNRKLTIFYAFAPVVIGSLLLMSVLLVVLNIYPLYDYNRYMAVTIDFYHSIGL